MTNKERDSKLSKLMRQEAPDWLTPDEYKSYLANLNKLKEQFDVPKNIKITFNLKDEDDEGKSIIGTPHKIYGSYRFDASPKALVDLYNSNKLFSQPETGQDPKILTTINRKSASTHAGTHWGWHVVRDEHGNRIKSSSQWLSSGTFNLTTYRSGKVVLEPCDVEHRLWGLVGFPLGLVTLESTRRLWFFDENLPEVWDEQNQESVRGFEVNGMYLQDIVLEAKNKGVNLTESEILTESWYSNNFTFTILPFYNSKETKEYFKEKNSSSAKSELQLFHASTMGLMSWMLRFSSPKYVEFLPMDSKYHPLYEMMSSKDRVLLTSLVISTMVTNYVGKGEKIVALSNVKLIQTFEDAVGFLNRVDDDEFKERILDNLDFLYEMVSSLRVVNETEPFPKRQFLLQLLLVKKHLEENDHTITDNVTFVTSLHKFYRDTSNEISHTGEKLLTQFGKDVNSSEIARIRIVHKKIKNDFLRIHGNGKLNEIGIVTNPDHINRYFSRGTILDSLETHKNRDVNGDILETKPVGGHIISDMELCRMNGEERDIAFQEEKLGDTFTFEDNCRAMSQNHNLRMGVLRLSEYLEIIHKSDESVKKVRQEKLKQLRKKPILK